MPDVPDVPDMPDMPESPASPQASPAPETRQEVYPPLIFQEHIGEAEQARWKMSLPHCMECGFRKGYGHALLCGIDFKPQHLIGEIGREEEWGIEYRWAVSALAG